MRFKSWLLMASMLLSQAAMASQTVLVFGDSLSAAYGIQRESGWVSLLEKKLAQEKPGYRVVNASVSGETSSGGLRRIGQALAEHKPSIVILELGANDGLRGLPAGEMQQNLAEIIRQSRNAKARVLLVGMKIPPNYGLDYTRTFGETYSTLAKKLKTPLVPFLLADVAGNPALTQSDGLHPVAAAQQRLLENVWPFLKPLL
ncbi:MAG TPA: arylesterase [Novimethylophilus sp.]|uniref:arylesterase n=1 Tax=Novimethylophilus sp. TaxID=2137426 RepID=UPI002F42E899